MEKAAGCTYTRLLPGQPLPEEEPAGFGKQKGGESPGRR